MEVRWINNEAIKGYKQNRERERERTQMRNPCSLERDIQFNHLNQLATSQLVCKHRLISNQQQPHQPNHHFLLHSLSLSPCTRAKARKLLSLSAHATIWSLPGQLRGGDELALTEEQSPAVASKQEEMKRVKKK